MNISYKCICYAAAIFIFFAGIIVTIFGISCNIKYDNGICKTPAIAGIVIAIGLIAIFGSFSCICGMFYYLNNHYNDHYYYDTI